MVKGIIINKMTNKVLYKFDTNTIPNYDIQNEFLVLSENINNIPIGAIYDSLSDSFIMPIQKISPHILKLKNIKTGEIIEWEVLNT